MINRLRVIVVTFTVLVIVKIKIPSNSYIFKGIVTCNRGPGISVGIATG
jgi:hypothetical protein